MVHLLLVLLSLLHIRSTLISPMSNTYKSSKELEKRQLRKLLLNVRSDLSRIWMIFAPESSVSRRTNSFVNLRSSPSPPNVYCSLSKVIQGRKKRRSPKWFCFLSVLYNTQGALSVHLTHAPCSTFALC